MTYLLSIYYPYNYWSKDLFKWVIKETTRTEDLEAPHRRKNSNDQYKYEDFSTSPEIREWMENKQTMMLCHFILYTKLTNFENLKALIIGENKVKWKSIQLKGV